MRCPNFASGRISSRDYGCIPLGWSRSGSLIWDHLDQGRSDEPMNPCPEWIHRFIWSTMIRMISDHWSWSGSSQRNAPGYGYWKSHITLKLELCTHTCNDPFYNLGFVIFMFCWRPSWNMRNSKSAQLVAGTTCGRLKECNQINATTKGFLCIELTIYWHLAWKWTLQLQKYFGVWIFKNV